MPGWGRAVDAASDVRYGYVMSGSHPAAEVLRPERRFDPAGTAGAMLLYRAEGWNGNGFGNSVEWVAVDPTSGRIRARRTTSGKSVNADIDGTGHFGSHNDWRRAVAGLAADHAYGILVRDTFDDVSHAGGADTLDDAALSVPDTVDPHVDGTSTVWAWREHGIFTAVVAVPA